MVTVVYLDTNIYIDFLKDRSGTSGGRYGDHAKRIFWRARKGELKIVFSEWVKKELSRQIQGSEVTMLYALIRKSIIEVKTEEEDKEEAIKLSRENKADALHVVLAKKAGAKFIITRNISHFRQFDHVVKSMLPEMFLYDL